MSRPRLLLPICSARSLLLMAGTVFRLMDICPAQEAQATIPAAPPTVPGEAGAADQGYLGVILSEIRPEVRAQTSLKDGEGLMICRVALGSPAERSGLCPYDILVRFDDQWVMSLSQVITLVENAGPGKEVELTTLRRGRERKTKVSLCSTPHPDEILKKGSLPLPVSPAEMLNRVTRTLRENPPALEAVYRMFHGPLDPGGEGFPEFREPSMQRFTMGDDSGEVEVCVNGFSRHLRVWDAQGKVIFDGPCTTPEQRAALPPGILARLETAEKEFDHRLHRRKAASAPAAPDNPQPGPGPAPQSSEAEAAKGN